MEQEDCFLVVFCFYAEPCFWRIPCDRAHLVDVTVAKAVSKFSAL